MLLPFMALRCFEDQQRSRPFAVQISSTRVDLGWMGVGLGSFRHLVSCPEKHDPCFYAPDTPLTLSTLNNHPSWDGDVLVLQVDQQGFEMTRVGLG